LRRVVGSDSRRPEDVRVRSNLGGQIMIIANHDHPIATRQQFPSDFFVLRFLGQRVMHCASTKYAHVGVIEEIGNTVRFCNGLPVSLLPAHSNGAGMFTRDRNRLPMPHSGRIMAMIPPKWLRAPGPDRTAPCILIPRLQRRGSAEVSAEIPPTRIDSCLPMCATCGGNGLAS